MPRTRGQEVALQERGFPTTPPQQLPTPRRTQKPRAGTRQSKQPVTTTSKTLAPATINSRNTRARSTSASQTDSQLLKPVRAAVKKRGRNAKPNKSKKVTQSTDEEVPVEPIKVLQELSDNSNSQAEQQLVPRESPLISSESSTLHAFQTAHRNCLKSSPSPTAIQSSKGTEEVAKTRVRNNVFSSVDDGNTHFEPRRISKDSALPPSASQQERKSQEQELRKILHGTIPVIRSLLENHPHIKGNAALERLLTLQELSVTMTALDKNKTPRLASPLAGQTPKSTDTLSVTSSAATPQRVSRYLKRKIGEADQNNNGEDSASKKLRTGSSQTKRVPVLFDEHGMLSLTAYKEVPINKEEEDEVPINEEESLDENIPFMKSLSSRRTASQRRRRPLERSPVTPQQPRGWTFSGLLQSAQTVSKFLPSFSRGAPAAMPSQIATPSSATNLSLSDNSTLQRITTYDRASLSEPRSSASESSNKNESPSARDKAYRRHRHSRTKRTLKAKSDKEEEIRMRDQEIARLRAQLKAQSEKDETQVQSSGEIEKGAQPERASPAIHETSAQQSEVMTPTVTGNQAIGSNKASTQTPKSILKRKTDSPNVIPNPPGGGYGLNLDYFGQNSDSDLDHGDEEPNTRRDSRSPGAGSYKKSRLTGEPATTPLYVGDRFHATPYVGKELALSPIAAEAPFYRDTIPDVNLDEERLISPETPSNGPTVTIRVPSPSDSDSEWDGTSYVEEPDNEAATPLAFASTSTPLNENVGFKATEGEAQTTAGSTSSQDPSALKNIFINPSFNFGGSASTTSKSASSEKAFPSTWTYHQPVENSSGPISIEPPPPNLALDKARQSALKHKPQQPSRLRETARFSTSTVGTEADNDEPEKTGAEHEGLKGSNSQSFQEPKTSHPLTGQVNDQPPQEPPVTEPVMQRFDLPPTMNESPGLSGEISADTVTSDEDLSDTMPNFDGYAKLQQLCTPRVQERLRQDWGEKEKAFDGYAALQQVCTPRVQEYLRQEWGENEKFTENKTAPNIELSAKPRADFEHHFEEFVKFQERQNEQNGKALSHSSQMSAAENVVKHIDNKIAGEWTDVDQAAAIEDFNAGFQDYLNQLL